METCLVMVDVAVDGVLKQNVFAFKMLASQPMPMPGDLIQIPEAAAARSKIPIALKVISRRFILDDLILDRLSRDCKNCIILLVQPPS